MLDLKQYLLALKFKWLYKIFDKNYTADWKVIENLYLNEMLFLTILRSNCRLNNVVISKLQYFAYDFPNPC